MKNQGSNGSSRRDFLKNSTVAVVGGALASHFSVLPGAYANGSDEIRIGLIGCGGRGTGAADNALQAAAASNIKARVIAIADAFKDRAEGARRELLKKYQPQIDLPDDRCFTGLDAYQKLLAIKDINYVILATPPGFRPIHLKAAVAAGKNIFTEKPVAVDGAGIRSNLEVYQQALDRGLAIVAGTQRRHQAGYIEAIKRVQDGEIGQIVAARAYWNQGGLWKKDRTPDMTDLEWQIRNWLYFTYLSGDHIVEQHVHNIDVINWAMGTHPVKAVGMGGRQSRIDPAYGHIFDHFAIDFEYENGVHMMSMCRQVADCANNVSEFLVGTKGNCPVDRWNSRIKKTDPYVQEHIDLMASIRSGKPVNELKTVSESTLTAIMGRMSAYTGKEVTWEKALNSQDMLMPADLKWGSIAVPPVAIPGTTPLI